MFLREALGRCAVHLPGAEGRFSDLYSGADWDGRELPGAVEAAWVGEEGVQVQSPLERGLIEGALGRGATVCADVTAHPPVGAFVADLDAELGTLRPGFAKLYVSPPGAGFSIHADADHVFILQIRGSKRWRFGPSPDLVHPLHAVMSRPDGVVVHGDGSAVLDDAGEPVPAPDPSALHDVVLGPGDGLYLPPGTWHQGSAEGESVALSVSPGRQPGLELATNLLVDLLRNDPDLRADLWCPTGTGGEPDPAFARGLGRALERAASRLGGVDPRTALRRFYRARARTHGGAPQVPGAGTALQRDTVLRPRSGAVYLVAPDPESSDDALFIYAGTEELQLPRSAEAWVARLFATQTYRGDDALAWSPGLDWEDVCAVLSELVSVGALEVVP